MVKTEQKHNRFQIVHKSYIQNHSSSGTGQVVCSCSVNILSNLPGCRCQPAVTMISPSPQHPASKSLDIYIKQVYNYHEIVAHLPDKYECFFNNYMEYPLEWL